jgi:transcriptional regulator with XRE-family HTH domain
VATRKKKTTAPAKETLGERIRRHRLSKGLTQAQLGASIGVTQRVVAYYELRGSTPPEVLARIADALDVTTDELLGRKKSGHGAAPKEPARDIRRLRHIQRLEELPLNDRKAVFRIIDALTELSTKQRRES